MNALGRSRRAAVGLSIVVAAGAVLWAAQRELRDASPALAGVTREAGPSAAPKAAFAVAFPPPAAVVEAAPVVPAAQLALASVAVDPAGRWVAQLRVNGGPARAALVGDVVSLGVRVQRIDAQGVDLQRGDRSEHLALPPGARPALPRPGGMRPVAAPGVISLPPDQPPPTTTAVDRAIQRAMVRSTGG